MYFERFQKDSAEVPGFVMPESIAVWDFFLAEQRRTSCRRSLRDWSLLWQVRNHVSHAGASRGGFSLS